MQIKSMQKMGAARSVHVRSVTTGAYYPKSANPSNGGLLRTTGTVGVQVGGGGTLQKMERQQQKQRRSELEPVYNLDKVWRCADRFESLVSRSRHYAVLYRRGLLFPLTSRFPAAAASTYSTTCSFHKCFLHSGIRSEGNFCLTEAFICHSGGQKHVYCPSHSMHAPTSIRQNPTHASCSALPLPPSCTLASSFRLGQRAAAYLNTSIARKIIPQFSGEGQGRWPVARFLTGGSNVPARKIYVAKIVSRSQ